MIEGNLFTLNILSNAVTNQILLIGHNTSTVEVRRDNQFCIKAAWQKIIQEYRKEKKNKAAWKTCTRINLH